MDNIIEYINNNASIITDQDFERLLPDIITHYNKLIDNRLSKIYGSGKDQLHKNAFIESIKPAFVKAFAKYKKNGYHLDASRSIGSYLNRTLCNITYNLKNSEANIKIRKCLCCPACRYLTNKDVPLDVSGVGNGYHTKTYTCKICTKHKDKHILHNVFASHSNFGFRCPKCNRFLPKSFTKDKELVYCIYDDCNWFGSNTELKPKAHPVMADTKLYQKDISLNFQYDKKELQDFITDNSSVDILDTSEIKNQIKVVDKILTKQINLCIRENASIKRLTMLKAYKELLHEDSIMILSYLNGKKLKEQATQTIIWQRYVKLIENQLPFTFNGNTIYSLLDKDLDLFVGTSEYEGIVNKNGNIPNGTYQFFNKQKCFIGYLIDVIDVETNKSLLDQVLYYQFQNIYTKLPKHKRVRVIQLDMVPHFSMKGMLHLQRARNLVVKNLRLTIQKYLAY